MALYAATVYDGGNENQRTIISKWMTLVEMRNWLIQTPHLNHHPEMELVVMTPFNMKPIDVINYSEETK